jgi:hypothetical protein
MRYLALFVALCSWLSASLSHSASKDALATIKQQIIEACEFAGGDGKFNPDSILERDVTGDGEIDLILDFRGLQCKDADSGALCGVRACLVQVYVHQGGKLNRKIHELSVGIMLGKGSRPSLTFISHEGIYSTMRWQNGRFRAQ